MNPARARIRALLLADTSAWHRSTHPGDRGRGICASCTSSWAGCRRRGEPPYLMNRISEYLGSGQRSSATSFSSLSATRRTASIAGITVSRM